jgi:ATP-binding cassette, subfamily C, type I secretion system permease/ATPase
MSLTEQRSTLFESLEPLRPYFLTAGAFSFFINILMIVPALYMLQVYDRALGSQSLATLGMLTIILLFLLAAMGGLDWARSQILIRAGSRLDAILAARVLNCSFRRSLARGGSGDTQALSDLGGLRAFIGGPSINAFFDTPWVPVYIFIMFAFHRYFGIMALGSIILLAGLTWANQRSTSGKLTQASKELYHSNNFANRHLRNCEVIESMGMMDDVFRGWSRHNGRVLALQTAAAEQSSIYTAASKTSRIALQSLALGLGAYLAIRTEISPGVMIAGSILLGRALAPVDLLVGAWKGFQLARQQYARLSDLLSGCAESDDKMALPSPRGHLYLDQVHVAPPGGQETVLKNICLDLKPGCSLGVIGPSASGKTSLARAILGVWPSHSGTVRLDGADICQWDRSAVGPHLGYLPQDIELFDGSIAQNIARFGEVTPDKVVEAAQLTGVHEMILRLPRGYDTPVGASDGILAGGQRQRIALARAVYGKPRLVVLDEPNSNLDDSGEVALHAALLELKSEAITVIVISHRPRILSSLDQILVMNNGRMVDLGPPDLINKKYQQPPLRLRSTTGRKG